MYCELCNKDGVKSLKGGFCCDCNLDVCTEQSRAPNQTYHSENCHCGCVGLVCTTHFFRHAQAHGNQPIFCFPDLGAKISIRATAAASYLTVAPKATGNENAPEQTPDALDHVQTINLFLNVLTNIPDAVRGKDPMNLGKNLGIKGPLWVEGADGLLEFSPDFILKPETLDSVLAIASNTAKLGAKRLAELGIERKPMTLENLQWTIIPTSIEIGPDTRVIETLQGTRGVDSSAAKLADNMLQGAELVPMSQQQINAVFLNKDDVVTLGSEEVAGA